MKILVLDAHAPAALTVIRSLARAGIAVDAAGEEGGFNLCFRSRFPRARTTYPSPAKSVGGFISFVSAVAATGRYRFILPITDRTIVPLQRFRSDWSDREGIVLPDPEALEKTLDKGQTLQLARGLSVPIPSTRFPEEEGIEAIAAGIGYPAVVKSRFSKYVSEDRLVSAPEPVFCGLAAELRTAVGVFPAGCLVQEMVGGDGYGISVLAREGAALAIFAHKRLREENPLGARSSFCESISPPPCMKDYALRLIKALKWTGPAMVEFKWDPSDGEPILMEINGRYWGSLPLALASGVDFPSLHYRMLTGETFPPVDDYRVGVRARYLYADLQRLIEVWKGPPRPWLKLYPRRGEAVRDFLLGFSPRIKSFNSDWDDPLPGWTEVVRFLHKRIAHSAKGIAPDKQKAHSA
jgi:predicted ATP-grasp superfamily ATP-dependent carboligase